MTGNQAIRQWAAGPSSGPLLCYYANAVFVYIYINIKY